MLLQRLRLVNFRQHADTNLTFSEGLTGIVGPNGAGKTTLLEAIAWAMYGTAAARGTRDSIRRRSAPPRSRVEVELDFSLGAHRYRISRTLQQAALYQDGEAAPIANSSAAVTDKVTRLLGMSQEEFFNTYFTGQKELAVMAAMSGPERARFLSRVLGYERLATVQVRLREERSALKASLGTAETGLIDLATLATEEREAAERIARADRSAADGETLRARAAAILAERQPEWDVWEQRRGKVQEVETDLNIALHRATESRQAFEELDRNLVEALAAANKRDELIPKLAEWAPLVETRDRLDREAQAYAGRRALAAQLQEVGSAAAELDKRLAKLPTDADLEAGRARAQASHGRALTLSLAADEQQDAWVREKQDAATKRTALLKQHEDLEKRLKRLREAGETDICPTCGRPLGKEYEKVLDDLETTLAEVIQEGRFYRQRIDQLASEPPELTKAKAAHQSAEAAKQQDQAQVVRLEAGLVERARDAERLATARARLAELQTEFEATPTQYDEAEHRRIRARLAALEPLRTELTRLTTIAERAEALVPRAAAAEQALSKLEARIVELRSSLAALGWSADGYERAKLALDEALKGCNHAELAVVRAEAERKAAGEHQVAVARRRAERDERAVEIERLKDEIVFNQELDRAFTDLRDDLNSNLRPELADGASALLRDLTNGRYSDLDISEDYLPAIVDDGEAKTVVSGGEEDVANLALRLAISQLIADRSGQPFSLLILDEVFGSLDEERRTAVTDLLRSLAGRFPQVILITHIESVRDGFDRVIRIDYDVERGIAAAREERRGEEASHVAA